jgi:hypothetical protein
VFSLSYDWHCSKSMRVGSARVRVRVRVKVRVRVRGRPRIRVRVSRVRVRVRVSSFDLFCFHASLISSVSFASSTSSRLHLPMGRDPVTLHVGHLVQMINR